MLLRFERLEPRALMTASICHTEWVGKQDARPILEDAGSVAAIHRSDSDLPSASTGHVRQWNDVSDWLYILQFDNVHLGDIAETTFDLVVMDYSSTGGANGEWTSAEIAALRNSEGGPKRAVSYLSIGEAEDYRFYWQTSWDSDPPDWLLDENPNFEGNYLVEFWNPEWQQTVFDYVDRILNQGFDGLYLDLVDAFEQFDDRMDDMVDFVIDIANYARANSPLGNDFAIFPQNAEILGDPWENPRSDDYLEAVNGIGKEETYFEATNIPTSQQDRGFTEENLNRFLNAGPWDFGLVLEVDYTDQQTMIDESYQRSQQCGYVPYVTNVELDQITFNEGHYNPRGDFDLDGDVDADDIDMLASNRGSTDPMFDLNRDGEVTFAPNSGSDSDVLVHDILNTEYGDANLDGTVSLEDLVALASHFNQGNIVGWREGDFSGDQLTSLMDLDLLGAHYGFAASEGAL